MFSFFSAATDLPANWSELLATMGITPQELETVQTGSFFGWLALVSAATFVLSLLLIPWMVARLPSTYFLDFSKSRRPKAGNGLFLMLFVLKNLVGIVLLVAGIAMLFLPGQGILTILIALTVLSFPGKQRLIGAIIGSDKVQKSMDWIRKKKGKTPFLWP
ncbi:PGPGW domain-containing protein [Desulforhopalus singaporensis]|nr:PGPGW domain-containing protein [Desulforhopalus singaporensis]